MSSTALVPAAIKTPVIQTSVNFAFNTDDFVHLAVEKKVASIEKEIRELNKLIEKEKTSSSKKSKDIVKKLDKEKQRIFETEMAHINAVFPKVKMAIHDYRNNVYIDWYGHRKTKPKSARLKELETELHAIRKPMNALCGKRSELHQAMNRTTLTSKYKAKLARIKLNELKSQGVDLLGLVDLD